MAAGCASLLIGCDEGSYLSNQTIRFDETQRDLSIQPIQVCNDFGQNCARTNVFADFTAKILEQARLKVNFLPTRKLNDSRFLSIDEKSSKVSGASEFYELSRTGGKGAYGRHPESTRDSGPINVWFVDEIKGESGYTQFGLAWVDGNGVLISEEVLDYNGGKGRGDTLAHEIGHNLGLKHTTLGAGGSNNLMTAGNNRNVPRSLSDVYPDGAGLSQLTLAQREAIINSPFVSSSLADGTLPSSLTAADLSTISLASLQIEAADDANDIPEPSAWAAIALVGISSLLLLKRQESRALSPATIPIVINNVSCLTPTIRTDL